MSSMEDAWLPEEVSCIEAIARILHRDVSQLEPNEPILDLSLDSLDIVELIMELEDQFAIDLEELAVYPDTTWRGLVTIIRGQMGR